MIGLKSGSKLADRLEAGNVAFANLEYEALSLASHKHRDWFWGQHNKRQDLVRQVMRRMQMTRRFRQILNNRLTRLAQEIRMNAVRNDRV